jgi:transketolase
VISYREINNKYLLDENNSSILIYNTVTHIKNIFVNVLDAYSIKPLDIQTIYEQIKKTGYRVVTVEDHYIAGGLGEAVASALGTLNTGEFEQKIKLEILAVRDVPRSGTPEELRAWAGIDAQSIERVFLDFVNKI